MKQYIIEKDYKSIYLYLKQHNFAENFIKNLRKKEGYILINNHTAFINAPLKKDDCLKINANPNTKTSIMHCILPLDIVYEDEFYLIVNKPAGLATMPSRSHYAQNLAGAICEYMDKKEENFVLRIVNRLDKDTCGLVVIAKDSIAQKDLIVKEKIYHALCLGKIDHPITIQKPIQTVQNEYNFNQHKRIISDCGKAATTSVVPIKYIKNKDISLIQLTLQHGRTHQIRLHLSSIGHPLLGDCLYGQSSNLIEHAALICKAITLFHPYKQTDITLQVDYPQDFKELLH